jgi:hypothetical protein
MHNLPGRAKHHAFLQDFLIGQGLQLYSPRRPLGAFEPLATPQVALSQAFVILHDTRVGVSLCPLRSFGHIDRQAESHLALARVAGGPPGRLVSSNDRGEGGHGGTNEGHEQ